MGGFRVQGKTEGAAARVLADAKAVAEAGAYSLVLEGIPTDLAKRITDEVDIPTIGIGAGPHCDGQVLVCYDLLGLTPDLKPKFVKRYAEFFEEGLTAARRYRDEVRAGVFPSEEYAFGNVKKTDTPAPASSLTLVRDPHTGYGPRG
jgi:3-methyl-2-oxobutanoate hydroxymethyltransferase